MEYGICKYPTNALLPSLFRLHLLIRAISYWLHKTTVITKGSYSNLEGAQEHPDVVTDNLSTEVSLGRVAGPFPPQTVPQVHISHFEVIPKCHTGKWRLIVD